MGILLYMRIERPDDVSAEWCSNCGDELLFSGIQSAGYAQFFCQNCRYRNDVYVGRAAIETTPADDSVTATGDR